MRTTTARTTSAILMIAVLGSSGAAHATSPPIDSGEPVAIDIPDARILSLSPNGQLLAARTETSGQADRLCVYDVATQAQMSCGDLETEHISMQDDNVFWSPDSTKLAFTENGFRYFIDSDLWLMDASDGALTNLTDEGFEGALPISTDDADQSSGPVYVDVLPAWAPDSRSIAISRSPIDGGRFTGNDIVSVDVTSGAVEPLTTVSPEVPGVVYFGLVWSPDGERLFYSVSYPDRGEPDNGVWQYDRSSGASSQILSSDPELGPPALVQVSADGATGLVIYPLAAAQDPTTNAFAVVDLDTEELTSLHPVPSNSAAPVSVAVATLSPVGAEVLYGLRDLGGDDGGRFFVRAVPDGKPRPVDAGADIQPFPTMFGGGVWWASDGTVFIATDRGSGQVLHINPG